MLFLARLMGFDIVGSFPTRAWISSGFWNRALRPCAGATLLEACCAALAAWSPYFRTLGTLSLVTGHTPSVSPAMRKPITFVAVTPRPKPGITAAKFNAASPRAPRAGKVTPLREVGRVAQPLNNSLSTLWTMVNAAAASWLCVFPRQPSHALLALGQPRLHHSPQPRRVPPGAPGPLGWQRRRRPM